MLLTDGYRKQVEQSDDGEKPIKEQVRKQRGPNIVSHAFAYDTAPSRARVLVPYSYSYECTKRAPACRACRPTVCCLRQDKNKRAESRAGKQVHYGSQLL